MEETKNVAPEEMLEREGNTFDFQAIYTSLILNWKWFVVSLIICVGTMKTATDGEATACAMPPTWV